MALRRLCKSGDSINIGECPAVYVDDAAPATMVAQGPLLDTDAVGKLVEVGAGEGGVRMPAETLLRAAGLYLAEHGRPAMLAEVQAFLAAEAAR